MNEPVKRLSDKDVEELVRDHYPEFKGVEASSMRALLLKTYNPSEKVDFGKETVERQLKNPNSTLTKIFYACLVYIIIEEATKQHNLHIQNTNAAKESLNNLPANVAKDKAELVNSAKESLEHADGILISNAELIERMNAQVELIKKNNKLLETCLVARQKIFEERTAAKAETTKQVNEVIQEIAPNLSLSGVVLHRINSSFTQIAKKHAGNASYEFEKEFDDSENRILKQYANQQYRAGNVTRDQHKEFVQKIPELKPMLRVGAERVHNANMYLNSVMKTIADAMRDVEASHVSINAMAGTNRVHNSILSDINSQYSRTLVLLSPLKTTPSLPEMRTGRSIEDDEQVRPSVRRGLGGTRS